MVIAVKAVRRMASILFIFNDQVNEFTLLAEATISGAYIPRAQPIPLL